MKDIIAVKGWATATIEKIHFGGCAIAKKLAKDCAAPLRRRLMREMIAAKDSDTTIEEIDERNHCRQKVRHFMEEINGRKHRHHLREDPPQRLHNHFMEEIIAAKDCAKPAPSRKRLLTKDVIRGRHHREED